MDEGAASNQRNQRTNDLTLLAVCGDPIVGRALSLLLYGSGYDVRLVSVPELVEPGVLDGVCLLVLTPTPDLSDEQRDDLLASLREVVRTEDMLVLRLVAVSGVLVTAGDPTPFSDAIPWPCSTRELTRRIEEALFMCIGKTADVSTRLDGAVSS